MEKEMEEGILQHFTHEHPLSLTKTNLRGDWCSGCGRYFTSGEAAYGCSKTCGYRDLLHEECAEMPREIKHPMHPQHVLIQQKYSSSRLCAVCQMLVNWLYYYCDSCNFSIHLGCAMARMSSLRYTVDEEEVKQSIKHPSHPIHELRLLRRLRKSCSFECDACGTIEKGNSYICSICQYWIHESCASLPETMDTEKQHHHHHHPLSLAFHLPIEYIKFGYHCDICGGNLSFKHWMYHCELCRYVVHIKCASSPPTTSIDNVNAADEEDTIQFPINDEYEELIKPFVKREGGEIVIPHDKNGKYRFHNHDHQLSLISLEENDDDDDNSDDDDGRRSKLICDGCTAPIYQKNTTRESSSLSSSDKYMNYYYMSCGECKYFLHLACFHLPPQLPSWGVCKHKLMRLQTFSELDFGKRCSICKIYMNGLFYVCTECDFKVDIKCASLPNTIKHAAHPKHNHYLTKVVEEDSRPRGAHCASCGHIELYYYRCGSCEFGLCFRCVLLPPAIKSKWDKHSMPLTFDANINHPSEFYCDICEFKMNPKSWMYHCRDCDRSFHLDCFTTKSGYYRNIKFGQQYNVITATDHDPHHPLTYQVITTKSRCDLCHWEFDDDDKRGFVCELCNFVMCLYICGRNANDENAIEAIH